VSVNIIDKLTNDLPEEVILHIDKFSKSDVWKLTYMNLSCKNSTAGIRKQILKFCFSSLCFIFRLQSVLPLHATTVMYIYSLFKSTIY